MEEAAIKIEWCNDLALAMGWMDPFNEYYPWQREDDVVTEIALCEVDQDLADYHARVATLNEAIEACN